MKITVFKLHYFTPSYSLGVIPQNFVSILKNWSLIAYPLTCKRYVALTYVALNDSRKLSINWMRILESPKNTLSSSQYSEHCVFLEGSVLVKAFLVKQFKCIEPRSGHFIDFQIIFKWRFDESNEYQIKFQIPKLRATVCAKSS